jgi:hypothetical protein
MKRKKASMFLCRALVSLIGMLMIGFLGLGVRAFATADSTQFIFLAACVISVAILVLYFISDGSLENRRPIRCFVNLASRNLSFCDYAQSVEIHSIWIICLKERPPGEARTDYARSDKPLSRAAAGGVGNSSLHEGEALSLSRFTTMANRNCAHDTAIPRIVERS